MLRESVDEGEIVGNTNPSLKIGLFKKLRRVEVGAVHGEIIIRAHREGV